MQTRVHLRQLTRTEWRLLKTKLRERTLPERVYRRYRIIAERRAGHRPVVVAQRVGGDVTLVADWTQRFNASGFSTFERPSNPKGREPILLAPHITALLEVALSSPTERGLPFARWSMATLNAYCHRRGLIPKVSDEWVRCVVHRQGLTPLRVRTWKVSHDPAFDRKQNASSRSIAAGRRGARSSASTSGAPSN